jgi:uncharacterized protein YlxW (UPF0749 family)
MSLLVDLVTNSLEPEYGVSAARRRAAAAGPSVGAHDAGDQDPGVEDPGSQGDERPPRASQNGGGLSRRIAGVAGLAAVGLMFGLGAWRARSDAPVASRAHTKLVDQVRSLTTNVDQLATTAADLRAASDKLRAEALSQDGTGAVAQLKAAENASAGSPLTGPGLHVLLDDAPTLAGQTADPASRVTDRDLQRIVNALWSSGAEAIAIGGVRLTARSSIRSAGLAILVDFRPVALPYAIDAIGDPATIEKSFTSNVAAADMRALATTYGIRFSVARANTVTVPAGADLELRLASPLPSSSSSPAPSTTTSTGGTSP